MKTFLKSDHPIITVMLKSKEPKALIEEIERTAYQGAEAYGLQLEGIPLQYRNRQVLKEIFLAMGDRPAYVTDYARGNVSQREQSDEELAEELLMAVECGAVLCDVRADLFDRCVGEFSDQYEAIVKQERLIAEIHRLGGEVLMSSHVFHFIAKEQVCAIAAEMQKRGADIAKIVAIADNEKELDEDFEALLLLKKRIGIPTLFLCNGFCCQKHRMLGPMLGSCMYLVVENGSGKTDLQRMTEQVKRKQEAELAELGRIVSVVHTKPDIAEAKRLLELSGYVQGRQQGL